MRSGGRGAWKDLFFSLLIFNWFIGFIGVLVLERRCERRLCVCTIFSFPFTENLWYRVGLGSVIVGMSQQRNRSQEIVQLKNFNNELIIS